MLVWNGVLSGYGFKCCAPVIGVVSFKFQLIDDMWKHLPTQNR